MKENMLLQFCFLFSDVCDTGWRTSRDGLIISSFLFTMLLFTCFNTLLLTFYRWKCEELMLFLLSFSRINFIYHVFILI